MAYSLVLDHQPWGFFFILHETFSYNAIESELFISILLFTLQNSKSFVVWAEMNVKFGQKLSLVVISGIDGPSEEIVHCTNVFFKEKHMKFILLFRIYNDCKMF